MLSKNRIYRILVDGVRISIGIIRYALTRKNSDYTYQTLIRLFCTTRGYSSDVLAFFLRFIHPKAQFVETKGVLGDLSPNDIARIASDLQEHGYHVFDTKLPEATCDALLNYAASQPLRINIGLDGRATKSNELQIVDRSNPQGMVYDTPNEAIFANEIVQDLFADTSLLSVAQAYFKSMPMLDLPFFRWSFAGGKEASVDGAQLYHFDMDRIKWLKFFFYITDVEEQNGPHVFIEGSHLSGNIPVPLLQMGYARIDDETAHQYYRKDQIISFKAKRGTIIAEDTRGLHKGAHVSQGDRLLLQVQFSASLFGTEVEPPRFGTIISEKLKKMIARYPSIYAYYLK